MKLAAEDEDLLTDEELPELDTNAEEWVQTPIQPGVYAAAFVLTVRSLGEGHNLRTGTLLMAWFWVSVSFLLQMFFLYSLYQYVAFGMKYEHDPDNIIHKAIDIVRHSIGENAELLTPLRIVATCRKLPSPYYYAGVAFLYNTYILGYELNDCRSRAVQIMRCPSVDDRKKTTKNDGEMMLVTGLMPCDRFPLLLGAVLPELIVVSVAWYVGMSLLVFSKSMQGMVIRTGMLILTLKIDWVIFQGFVSASKRHWVQQSHVLTMRNRYIRMMISWPGELLKFISVVMAVLFFYFLFHDQFELQNLCWQCAMDCKGMCSRAFSYCDNHNALFPTQEESTTTTRGLLPWR